MGALCPRLIGHKGPTRIRAPALSRDTGMDDTFLRGGRRWRRIPILLLSALEWSLDVLLISVMTLMKTAFVDDRSSSRSATFVAGVMHSPPSEPLGEGVFQFHLLDVTIT